METINAVAQNVARVREERGMSQAELRRRTGINVWRIENGHYGPRLETLEKIARELGVEVYELLK